MSSANNTCTFKLIHQTARTVVANRILSLDKTRTATLRRNNQTGCISGEDKDPKFAGVTLADTPTTVLGFAPAAFSIKGSSPCFDRGVLLEGQQYETDLLGNPRVRYDEVDMGALECFYKPGFFLYIR